MLIPSAPGAPLLDLTFFHASVILALDTMYSTDAKSKGDDSVTRQASKSPAGINELPELTGIAPHTALGPFPGMNPQVLVLG